MINKIIVFYVLLSLFTNNVQKNNMQNSSTVCNSADHLYNTVMKKDILSIMAGYPGYISDIKIDGNGNVFLIMKSGRKIIYDDKKKKDYSAKLSNPDLQDMMEPIYPLSGIDKLSNVNFDPGRSREYELLKEVYGESQKRVEKNLANVNIGRGICQFNRNNKANESLSAAMKELSVLAASNHKIAACIYPVNGTYNYRVIAGTNRLSPHSFGIAIDLARDKRDYWQWASREEGEKRLASYPGEIVKVFEKNNFIWGGKWGHFDILHFEYRPEIIFKARYFGDIEDTNKSWHEGVPESDYIRECIDKIDRIL